MGTIQISGQTGGRPRSWNPSRQVCVIDLTRVEQTANVVLATVKTTYVTGSDVTDITGKAIFYKQLFLNWLTHNAENITWISRHANHSDVVGVGFDGALGEAMYRPQGPVRYNSGGFSFMGSDMSQMRCRQIQPNGV